MGKVKWSYDAEISDEQNDLIATLTIALNGSFAPIGRRDFHVIVDDGMDSAEFYDVDVDVAIRWMLEKAVEHMRRVATEFIAGATTIADDDRSEGVLISVNRHHLRRLEEVAHA